MQIITVERVLAYLRFMFMEKNLAPTTVATYKEALAKPLRLIFGTDVSINSFHDFIKALHNIRPAAPMTKVSWSLDKVLCFAISEQFSAEKSLLNSLYITAFLLALATGSRVSELHSVLRGEEYMEFSDLGVTMFPNPNFLAKNEAPNARRTPIFISRLKSDQGEQHPLCPVGNLELYLKLSSATKSIKLFVHPSSLTELSVHKLRYFICKFIRSANPGSFLKSHDLQKLATSYAFFQSMSTQEICDLVGWSSVRVFKKHYLKQITAVSSSIICLGKEISPPKL